MLPHSRRIALVCNARAGNGKALAVAAWLETALTEQAIPYTNFTSEWPGSFAGYTDVFLCGGDGTLNYFVNHYPDSTLPIALFKGGTGNDFTWKLYGDIELPDQLQLALQATPKPVDAGRCNNQLFMNGVGIGFDGEVVQAREDHHLEKGRHGSYKWTVLKYILFYREGYMQLEYDNQVHTGKQFMVSVANGSRYGNGFMIAPQATVTDGLLNVVAIGKVPPLKRFYYLSKVQKGLHLQYDFVKTKPVKNIVIRTGRITIAHMDGELIQSQVFDIEALPGRFLFRY